MAFNDAFGLWGHLEFSSKPTHGRSIFTSLSDGMGESYNVDFNGYQQGRLYAQSICLATAQYQLDRALNNRNPAKATEILGQLEDDFQVTPGPYATLKQRRDFLSALFMVATGNSQSAIEYALQKVLGSDFVSYTHLTASPWPPTPGTVGIFPKVGDAIKQFSILDAISTIGSPVTVRYSITPTFGDLPLAGETYVFDPDPRSTIENVELISVNSTTITAVFTRSHEIGTVATRPYPLWTSSRRYSTVIVSLSAAMDSEKRRLVNEIMSRAMRGVSQWCMVSDIGPLVLDSSTSGLLGYTTLG